MSTTRAFEKTHPWIDFRIDLTHAPVELWVLLGEAQSKVEHIAGTPLRPDVAAELHKIYLTKGALATTAIEGNTLTENEVRDVVDGRSTLPPSKEYLKVEVENILRACNGVVKEIDSGTFPVLNTELLCSYNREVLQNLALDDASIKPGEIRRYPVGVGRYRAAPAEDCEYLLDRLCKWLDGPDFHPPTEHLALAYAVIKAAAAHLYIAWIHPFGDGNGRTARLVEFRILSSSGFPLPAAHLLSDHYNQTRTEYYRCLEASTKRSDGEAFFMQYAVRGLVDGLRQQINLIRDQQLSIVWRDYVHERLGGPGQTEHRRRALVFALSATKDVTPLDRIANLNAGVAAAYATRTSRTLARDLGVLLSEGLVERTKNGYRARMERIHAFLPLRHLPDNGTKAPTAG